METGEVIENKAELFAALAQAQSQFSPIETDKKVDFVTKKGVRVKYDYASFAAIFKMAQKPLTDNGLAVYQVMMNGSLITTLAHKSGQSISSVSPLPTNSNDIKQLGANLSYLRRYQYTAIIGAVVSDEDDESAVDGEVHRANGNKPTKRERPMSPDEIKQVIALPKYTRFDSKPTDKDFKAMQASLNKAGFSDERRHQFGEWAFGKPSSKDWTNGECRFVIDWIGCNKDNDFTPNPDALKEAQAIIESFNEEEVPEQEISF